MIFKNVTIDAFFGQSKITYIIPAYQRAYSWDEQQLKTFLEDLMDFQNMGQGNSYCYGNVLLETIKQDKKWEIIDGQQRITTISIFMRALLNTIRERINNGIVFMDCSEEEIDVEYEESIFFKDHGTIKLQTTQQDRGCFETLIIDNQNNFNCITPSQKRILFAKNFFIKELKKISDEKIINIFNTIKNATINKIELIGKKESAMMFELQNNRGKDLTNLEKLKSFLMYQLYVFSKPEEVEANIQYVSNQFNPIYTIINQMSVSLGDDKEDVVGTRVTEDNILMYHSYAYSKKNFGYRSLNDIIEEFKEEKGNKITWIKSYALNLYNSFSTIQSVMSMEDDNLNKLKKMEMPFFVYPFIIKGANNKNNLPELFRLLEVLSFRYKLVNSRADIRGKLNEIIKEFDGDVDLLSRKLSEKMEAEYYWSDRKVLEILNGNMYKNNMKNYFLWEYEQYLQRKGYTCGDMKIVDESIEHISPQSENVEWIESGYEVDDNNKYSVEYEEKYINCLGNLMLISQSHNSSVGNRPFKEKLLSYSENPLLCQQTEIKNFVKNKEIPLWDKTAISNRLTAMIDFAKKRWSFVVEK